MEACSKHVGDKWPLVGAQRGSNRIVVIKLLCFRRLSPFFKPVEKGSPGFAESQAIFAIHVVSVNFQFNDFPDELVHVSGFCRKKFCVLYFNNTVLVDNATADLSVCASRICLLVL